MVNISFPPIFINEYISEKIMDIMPESFDQKFRFFPQMPTDINSLTDDFANASNDVFVIFDRMLRIRNAAFPHVKSEQVIYYFYKMANVPDELFEVVQIVHDLLDREDESGQEINEWIQSKVVNGTITFGNKEFKPIFFHSFKVYQLQETKDVMFPGTVRTFSGAKIIIEYKYHTQDYDN